MTRTYKEIEKPAELVEVLDKCVCDLCGKESPIRFDRTASIRQQGEEYEVTHVSIEKGKSWSDSGDSRTTSYDICGQCFCQIIMPFMEQQGAKPTVEDCDW